MRSKRKGGRPVKAELERPKAPTPMPVEWWEAMSRTIGGQGCPKCGGLTRGDYDPPSRESEFECCVIEHCNQCGWSPIHVTGYHRILYSTQPNYPRSALKVVGNLVAVPTNHAQAGKLGGRPKGWRKKTDDVL